MYTPRRRRRTRGVGGAWRAAPSVVGLRGSRFRALLNATLPDELAIQLDEADAASKATEIRVVPNDSTVVEQDELHITIPEDDASDTEPDFTLNHDLPLFDPVRVGRHELLFETVQYRLSRKKH